MTSAFVIQVLRGIAGLAIRQRSGFLFHASDPLFRRIDGQWFRNMDSVRAAVNGLVEAARIAVDQPGPHRALLVGRDGVERRRPDQIDASHVHARP